jgi:hypothetical protein
MANYQLARNSFKGKMNKDLDPIEIQNQEYIDALNAQFLSDSEGKTLNIMPVIGNTLAFDLGSVVAKNKKYRIYVPGSGNYSIKIYKTDGITPYVTNSIPFSDLISLQFSIITELNNAGISFIQSINVTDMFLEVELTSNLYYDYIIKSIGVDDVDIKISQESIDPSMSGSKRIIGSNDLLGDLFIFSTTSNSIQEEIGVSSISNNGSGLIRVQTSAVHGLQDFEYVSISGTGVNADGTWQINVIDSTRFDLILSTFVSTSSTGIVNINIYGYGEIGVATYDLDLDQWNYTRLIASKEFGFTTKKQVESDCEKNIIGKSFYFHQVKYNDPRVFYYTQNSYIQDGALSINGGRYEYGNINNELKLVINYVSSTVKLIDQELGGSISSGNKIYFVRLLTSNDSLASTPWHGFSNIVSVYSASQFGYPSDVIGNNGDICAKTNVLEVENIDFETFNYIELGVAEYSGDAVVGRIILRTEITGNTMELRHSGYETNVRDLALEEIFQTTLKIKSVGSQTIIDNRLVLANIVLGESNDFSEFAKTITHEIVKEKISNNGGYINDIRYGGYQDPLIIHNKLGYTINETYRFGIQIELKNGDLTPAYWIDDIKIDTSATNISLPNRRTGAPSNFDLAPNAAELYIWYVKFGNINFDYKINGNSLRDIAKSLRIVRVDLDSNVEFREILLTGAGIQSLEALNSGNGFPNPATNVIQAENPGDGRVWYGPELGIPYSQNPKYKIYPFPFFSGQKLMYNYFLTGPLNPTNINNYPFFTQPYSNSLQFQPGVARRDYMIIYSPDNIYDNYTIDYRSGDKLIVFGNYKSSGAYEFAFGNETDSYHRDFWAQDIGTPGIYDLVDSKYCSTGGVVNIGADKYYCVCDGASDNTLIPGANTIKYANNAYVLLGGQIIKSSLQIVNNPFTNPNTSEGCMFVQYYRPKSYDPNNPNNSKFGSLLNTVYVDTGAKLEITNSTSLANIDVYGGDTFTCRTELRLRTNTNSDNSIIVGDSNAASFTTQSRANFAMRAYLDTSTAPMWTKQPDSYEDWLFSKEIDQVVYDISYNNKYIKNLISFEKENDLFVSELPTRIIYSNLKPQNSLSDSYRVFPPLQFKDLDPQYGEITHIENINDELFVWQPRNWQREFFNTTGILTSSDSDYIVMGNSGVMSRKGQRVSSYGTSNKWSVVKARTRGGRDQVFWIDQENGVVLRFGADGTNTISLLWGMFSFFNNNLKWAGRYDTPADGKGIAGVWNERYQEAIYSIRGYRNTNSWTLGREVSYNVGDIVNNGVLPIYGFPSIYVCTQEHISTPQTEPGSGSLWQQYWDVISTDNNDYYNLYSFVISEVKNGFTTFLTPKPLIYLPWKNKYLTPHPSDEYCSNVFEENKGDYCVWYKINNTEVSENGYIESVININPMDVKTFVDILSQSEYKPHRVEFAIDLRDYNQNLVELRSYLVENDFDYKEGVWVSPIKNDTTTAPNGTPDEDTSQLYGNYIKVKLYMEKGKFQKLQNYLIKFQFNSRYNAT